MKRKDKAPVFTVRMLPGLADALDEIFSPSDAIEAFNQLYGELPARHQAASARGARRFWEGYRGRFAWFDLGFTYVQGGRILLVVELWPDEEWNTARRNEVDCVLGERG